VLVHRIAGGLHHKNISAANVLQQLEVNLAIGKALHLGLTQRHADVLANLLRQSPVCRSGKNLEALVVRIGASPLLLCRLLACAFFRMRCLIRRFRFQYRFVLHKILPSWLALVVLPKLCLAIMLPGLSRPAGKPALQKPDWLGD
jgi:hypothetical protein